MARAQTRPRQVSMATHVALTHIFAVLIAIATAGEPAYAAWKDASYTDPLTKKKISMQSLDAMAPIHQSSHAVKVALHLRCDNDSNREKSANRDHYSVALVFSERVATEDVPIRYSFDGSPLVEHRFGTDDQGTTILLSPSAEDTDVSDRLKTASTLRLQASLPSAGTLVMEFAIDGAAAAFQKIPCGP